LADNNLAFEGIEAFADSLSVARQASETSLEELAVDLTGNMGGPMAT